MPADTVIAGPAAPCFLSFVRFAALDNWSASAASGRLAFHASIPLRPLAEVMKPVRSPVIIRDDEMYDRVTVRIHGGGVLRRDSVPGSVIKTKRQFRVASGQFIMSRIDARNGAFGLIPGELDGAIVTNDFPVFAVDGGRMLADYLRLVTSTPQFRDYCQTLSKGTTNRQRMDEQTFLAIPIPLPPLADQARLVEAYRAALAEGEDAEARARGGEQEAARFLETSLGLQTQAAQPKLASGKLHFFPFATMERWGVADESEGLKSAYPLTPLGSLLELVQYGLSEKARKEPTPVPLIRMNNVRDGELDFTDLKFLTGKPANYAACLLRKGDILFNRTNSKELVGKTAVFLSEGDYVFASYLIRLRLRRGIADPHFINYVFNSPFCRSQIDSISRQVLGQANINSKELRAFLFPLPPLLEQQRIVARLDALRSEARAARAAAAAGREAAAAAFTAALFAVQ